MVTRKGELSKMKIDQGWPYQVALESSRYTGAAFITIQEFCTKLNLCPRGHAFRKDHRAG